uniref:Uncharacterized protein AlNc14C156G7651 n=1 Tax=Albugo laibachii Nc14 TaxID=890382 RepID=F0WMG1_9STRA|nr:conserved hypothetical protein [Albugo laibachii Nc14]|eukprot:CCA22493.1 conserved hypothetical protein [Albugo laibachii Nc14]
MSSSDDETLDVVVPPTRKKRRRRSSPFAVLDDEDEEEEETSQSAKPSTKVKLKRRNCVDSTKGRKSARLARKRQEQEAFEISVKDILHTRTLDNCLEALETSSESDNSESKEDDSSASDDSPSEKGFDEGYYHDSSEKVYADGDGDLDDFICDDDQVEYMNGEKGDQAEAHVFIDNEDLQEDTNHSLQLRKSRTKKEWFHLYMQYLEHCIVDPKSDKRMREEPSKYSLFQQSLEHIESELHFRYQTLLNANGIWPSDLTKCIQSAARITSIQIETQTGCDACKHRGHAQTYRLTFSGYAFDATRLYRGRWMRKLLKDIARKSPIHANFQVGNICRAVGILHFVAVPALNEMLTDTNFLQRIISSWELLHSKRLWCAIIDRLRESCSSDEFLPEEKFSSLVKNEFGRYKRLISIPERFMGSSKDMGEVCKTWEDIYKSAAKSKFLMTRKARIRRIECDGSSESDNENADQPLLIPLPQDDAETEYELVESEAIRPVKREDGPLNSESGILQEKNGLAAKYGDLRKVDAVKQMKCLLCEKNPRDGAILHDRFIHFHCCYTCGMDQKKKGTCAICNRVISKVYRVSALDDMGPAPILHSRMLIG